MKKNILLILFFLCITSISFGQLIRGYGLKLGATVSQQNWDYSFRSGSSDYKKTGFNAGVFAEFLDVPFISVVTELNYIQKGMKDEIPVTSIDHPDGTGETITQDASINYFNIAALGKVRFSAGLLSPYIIVGPRMDFELNRNSTLKDMKDFKKNRLGVKIGVGSEINLLKFNLLAEFLYDKDFSELNDTQLLKIKTQSFDFRIGIFF